MTETETRRLTELAANLTAQTGELAALLRMPADEDTRGDLPLLDEREYTECVHRAVSNVAWQLLQVDGLIDRLTGRIVDANRRATDTLLKIVPRQSR